MQILIFKVIITQRKMTRLSPINNRFEVLNNYCDSTKSYVEESIEQETTKNPLRKFKKKLRILQEKYRKTRDDEVYNKIQTYKNLIKIEENKLKPKTEPQILVKELVLTFEQILEQDKSKYRQEDRVSTEIRKQQESKELINQLTRDYRRKVYKRFKNDKEFLKKWQESHVKNNKEYIDYLTKSDFPEDIKSCIWNPYLYNSVSEKYKLDKEKKDGYLFDIIEKVKGDFDKFKKDYKSKNKKFRKSKRKSPKKPKSISKL